MESRIFPSIICHVCEAPMRMRAAVHAEFPLVCSDRERHRRALARANAMTGSKHARLRARKIAAGRCPCCSLSAPIENTRPVKGGLCGRHWLAQQRRQGRIPKLELAAA